MARQSAIPMGMRRVHWRFERWRRSHVGRLPIPERLWTAAAELAREHGVFKTAKLLRLDYNKLKSMAESTGPIPRSGTPATSFLEVVAPRAIGPSECLIELEGPRGKVRIQWKGTGVPDLAGLSRALWESA